MKASSLLISAALAASAAAAQSTDSLPANTSSGKADASSPVLSAPLKRTAIQTTVGDPATAERPIATINAGSCAGMAWAQLQQNALNSMTTQANTMGVLYKSPDTIVIGTEPIYVVRYPSDQSAPTSNDPAASPARNIALKCTAGTLSNAAISSFVPHVAPLQNPAADRIKASACREMSGAYNERCLNSIGLTRRDLE